MYVQLNLASSSTDSSSTSLSRYIGWLDITFLLSFCTHILAVAHFGWFWLVKIAPTTLSDRNLTVYEKWCEILGVWFGIWHDITNLLDHDKNVYLTSYSTSTTCLNDLWRFHGSSPYVLKKVITKLNKSILHIIPVENNEKKIRKWLTRRLLEFLKR